MRHHTAAATSNRDVTATHPLIKCTPDCCRFPKTAMSWIARWSRSSCVLCVIQDSLSASSVSSVTLLLGLIHAWSVYSLMTMWRRSSSTVVNVAYVEWVAGIDSFTARHVVAAMTRRCRFDKLWPPLCRLHYKLDEAVCVWEI